MMHLKKNLGLQAILITHAQDKNMAELFCSFGKPWFQVKWQIKEATDRSDVNGP